MNSQSDYQRGYDDGVGAAHEARGHAEAGTALGEMVGDVLANAELVIDEYCNAGESDDYKEGFRQGVRDTF